MNMNDFAIGYGTYEDLEQINVLVSRQGSPEGLEKAWAVPGLNKGLITEHLLDQFSNHTIQEVLDGIAVGGLYIDPETLDYRDFVVYTDGIAEQLKERGEEVTEDSIEAWLRAACETPSTPTGLGFVTDVDSAPQELRLTDRQFHALAELLRLRGGASQKGARLVLVEGLDASSAARQVGTSRQAISQAVSSCKRGYELACIAVLQ